MKKILFLSVAMIGLWLSGCTKQEVAPSSTDDIFASIQSSAARSAADTDPVTKEKCKGKLTNIEIAALPSSITAYITKNYAGAAIKFAGKDDKGQYVVGVSLNNVETGLLFDAAGTFVQALQHYKDKAKLTEVAITTLPASVTSYVASKYAGYTVKRAGKDADGNLFIGIHNGTDHKVLLFDATGAFKEEKAIPQHDNDGKGGKGKPKGGGK
jgi:hypothetical protein